MCGIAGWWQLSERLLGEHNLTEMRRSLQHRGPDDTGIFFDEKNGLALGHNRLSIIDLSPAGRQPMIHPETGDVLVFNGEIYNFRELRRELEAMGARFASQSDSEVLLNSLAVWGSDCLRRIQGMYAFAFWRPRKRELVLARDPMGIKPLYYWIMPGGGIAFASEIKAFLTLPKFPRKVDRRALGQFLEFGYSFENSRTIFAGVRKLPPGHLLQIGPDGTTDLQRCFEPALATEQDATSEDWENELHAALSEVVADHMIADVPVALLLSGGLDSSLLAALAAKLTPIKTLSMGFKGCDVDERPQARQVAKFIGSEHTEIFITPEEIRKDLERTVACFDDLFADWGTISTRLLYKKSREKGVKVVLVGEGADELFGGYSVFRHAQHGGPRELWLFGLYRAYCGRRYGSYYGAFRRLMGQYLDATSGDRFSAIRLFETRNQLPNNYVMKVDKASMSMSIEARVPYLDKRVAEIAYRIPSEYLLSPNGDKLVLRRLAKRYGLLPKQTYERPKFGVPIASSWIDDSPDFRRYAQKNILAPDSWTNALGLGNAMSDYFIKNQRGYAFPRAISIFPNLAWRLLALELWSRSYGLSAHAD